MSTETEDGRKLQILKDDRILRVQVSVLKSQIQTDAS